MVKRPKPIKGVKNYWQNRRPSIQDVLREATAGGIVVRRGKKGNVEVLLVQDAKDRWTIPKGHVEEGEESKDTAEREVMEETGLKDVQVHNWLGKIHFRYRRQNSLILMTTQIFLVEAKGDTNALTKESWMKGIDWFDAYEALDMIEYEDISKLILLALKRIRQRKLLQS